jgi:2,5-furandicarboxylate decarboxylase 1
VDVYIKQAVVVDDDIDIFDPDQVHWALTVRFQADRDTIVVPNCRGVRTDPSAYALGDPSSVGPYTTKMGLDGTVSLDRPPALRADLPPEGYEDLDLAAYLPAGLPGSMTRSMGGRP